MERLVWLERNQFLTTVDSQPRSWREWQRFQFEIDPNLIYSELPATYVENPDEDSFSGDVRRWYGQIDDSPFIVDVHLEVSPDRCVVQTPHSSSRQYAWQTLFSLRLLPKAVHIMCPIWISNDPSTRVQTVFRRDARGFDYPVYDGVTEDDSLSLLKYLSDRQSRSDYLVGKPEPTIDWVANEIVGRSHGHRARYPSRATTLDVACRMSCDSNNAFVVLSESPSVDGRRYLIRNGVVENTG